MIAPQAPSHHIVNSVAVGLPLASLIAHAPEVMTTVTATLGAVWYVVLLVGKFNDWRRK